jgi:hypothetical protein
MWCFPIILIHTLHSECHSPLHKLSTALWRLILSDTALCHSRTAVVPRFKWSRRFALLHCSQCHVQFAIRMNCQWLVSSKTWCFTTLWNSCSPFIAEIHNLDALYYTPGLLDPTLPHISVACVFRNPIEYIKILEVLGRTNRLLSFDTTRTEQKTKGLGATQTETNNDST